MLKNKVLVFTIRYAIELDEKFTGCGLSELIEKGREDGECIVIEVKIEDIKTK